LDLVIHDNKQTRNKLNQMKKHLLLFTLLLLISVTMLGQTYSISLLAEPTVGGSVQGGGYFPPDTTITIRATANTNAGYYFSNWTTGTGSNVPNAGPEYSFTVTQDSSFVAHFSNSYEITATANPTNGGSIIGAGSYEYGTTCELQANPSTGYYFVNWTEDGEEVSTQANFPPFTVTGNRTLVANFSNSYEITATINPSNAGVVTGAGTYTYNQTCELVATPNEGYHFVSWTNDGIVVDTTNSISFSVTENKSYVANFSLNSYQITASANPSDGGGASVSSTGTNCGTFNHNQNCTVIAAPATGYNFINWTENGDEVSLLTNYQFAVTSDRDLVANFALRTYTIAASADPNNGGTITGAGTYSHGSTCTLTATANDTYDFVNWTKDGQQVSNNLSYTFTVSGQESFVAHFQLKTHAINASSSPENGGTITGDSIYNHGSTCYLTATPSPGYSFTRWTENGNQVSTNTTYSFTVNGPRTLVAHFSQQNYVISLTADPSSGGSAMGGGGYHYGENCTAIATTNAGFAFVNWTENGNEVSNDANYHFTVTGNRSLVAHFEAQAPDTYSINVSANPSNGGNVTGGGNYPSGQSCTVTATANSGYTFTNWTEGNNVVSNNANYTFTVNNNHTLKANFTAQSYSITATANPSNGGTVSGSGSYNHGQNCTLSATPATGYDFVKWTKNGQQVSTNATYSFNVTESAAYVAHFQIKNYTITASADPTNGGVVTGANNYTHGQSCTLTATANSGYNFVNWTKNGQQVSTDATYTFNVTESAVYVAHFQIQNYTITVEANPADGGTVSGGGNYDYGEWCTVHASANQGWTFINWTEDGEQVSSSLDYTFEVTGDRTLVANFTSKDFIIYVEIDPEVGGTATGAGGYNLNDECTLKATARPGYTFINWTKDGELVTTDFTFTFTVSETATYVAHFQMKSYNITVIADPEEGGTVSGDGIYAHGAYCTLTATPANGYQFSNWKLGNTIVSTEATYMFQVTTDAIYTATFTPIPQYTITTIAEPTWGGTVIGGGQYYAGVICNLHATPAMGYQFENWKTNGAVFSTEQDCSFEVTSNATYTACFREATASTYTIITEVYPEETGTVIGGGSYEAGSSVELTAIPNEGYDFVRWQDGISDNPRTITVTGNATYTAYFREASVPCYIITTEASPADAGTVTGGGTYSYDEQASLTAIANPGYEFERWQDGNTENPRVITVMEDATYTAIFKIDTCIEDLQEIVAKEHKEGNETYILLLVYPNPNDENYQYQWLYSTDDVNYSDLKEGTYNNQYYYKGGRLKDGYYKVRVSTDGCSDETGAYYVNNGRLRIYPNPVRRNNNIVVVNDSNGPAQLAIYSTDGRLLHAQTVTGSQAIINLNLPVGIYVAYFTNSEGNTKMGKLIIQ
jgi:uncharacterized repeat protein (TIGR02543 family)